MKTINLVDIRTSSNHEVQQQVSGQVREQVRNQVWKRVWVQVWYSCGVNVPTPPNK